MQQPKYAFAWEFCSKRGPGARVKVTDASTGVVILKATFSAHPSSPRDPASTVVDIDRFHVHHEHRRRGHGRRILMMQVLTMIVLVVE
jgi:GNAT superfamily N-acetyltransferase